MSDTPVEVRANREWLRKAGALIEPVAVFAAATLLASALLKSPIGVQWSAAHGDAVTGFALRWLPLLIVALLVDVVLRWRGFGAWGLLTAWRAPLGTWRALSFLLLLGGVPALILTMFLPTADGGLFQRLGAEWRSQLAVAAALISPVAAQEVFLCGYAQRRFSDALNRWVVAFIVAVLFGLAHLSHAAAGELGWAFVGAMALQGFVWSLARSAGTPLTVLIAAHLLLLLAYEAPPVGIGVIMLGALFGAGSIAEWVRAVAINTQASRAQSEV